MLHRYIEQKTMAHEGRFEVYDEAHACLYRADEHLLSAGKKLTLYDAAGAEAATVSREAGFVPKYRMRFADGRAVTAVKRQSLWRPRYDLDGADLTASGNFMQTEFRVMRDDREAGQILFGRIDGRRTIELIFPHQEEETLFICFALILNHIHAAARMV